MKELVIGSIVALGFSLGLILNFVIVVLLAMLHGGKITLNFNRFHEGWAELVFCILILLLGSASLIYLASTY